MQRGDNHASTSQTDEALFTELIQQCVDKKDQITHVHSMATAFGLDPESTGNAGAAALLPVVGLNTVEEPPNTLHTLPQILAGIQEKIRQSAAAIRRSVNATGPNGSTALLMAISKGDVAAIKALVQAGASLDAEALEFNDALPTDEKRVWYPLHCAVSMTKVRVLQLLLELGANPNCGKITDGCTPLHTAQHLPASTTLTTRCKIIRLLLLHGANPNATRTDGSGTSPLHDAIEQGQPDSVRLLLRGGGSPNAATFDDGSTPLHIVVRWRQDSLHMLQMLVAFGARFDIPDMNNRTAKEWAVTKGRKVMVAWMEAVTGWSSLEVAAGCRLYADTALMLREGFVEPPQDTDERAALLRIASEVPSWDTPPPICRATVQLVRDAMRSWSPARHWLHHARHRQAAVTVMLTAERLRMQNQGSSLPLASATTTTPIPNQQPSLTPPSPVPADASDTAVSTDATVSEAFVALPQMPPEMWISILKFVRRSHFLPVGAGAREGVDTASPASSVKPSSKLRPLLVI